MTNQEAKTLVCEHREFVAFPPVIQGTVWRQKLIEALDLAIESLEKADRYRWHDLRKNPEDLPVLGEEVEIVYEYRLRDLRYHEITYRDAYGTWAGSDEYDMEYWSIIAWREIEPFEVEE